MNKEEKEAIEYLKGKFEFFEEDDTLAKWDYEAINTILDLIDKLQKENEDMREELQMYVDTDVMKLQEENKDLKKEIDNLIKENHKHIDYIASMKKKQEDKIKAFKKENEKLKDRIEYLGNEKHALYQDNISLLKEKYGAESLNYKYIEMPPVEVKGYISEDKIRAKIKELEKTKNYIISMYAIGILEELLGDDE